MALIKCKECGHEISDKAIRCPKCGCPTDVGASHDVITKNNQDLEVNEKYKSRKDKPKQKFSADKEKENSQIKKYAIVVALLIAIVGCGCWWYQHTQQQEIVVSPSTDETKKQVQGQNIIQENSFSEITTDTFKENIVGDSACQNEDVNNKIAVESVKAAKTQGPKWIQGTWLYSFPDGENPETGDCTYCKVNIDGDYLTIVEETCGNSEAYEYHGKWKYKNEGDGYFIYYFFYGGKGIELDFDKELLILPQSKYVNGERVYTYMHKVSD